MPPKVQNFLWRLLHNSLPTKENLFRRKVMDNDNCPLCQRNSESTIHMVWNCLASNNIWAAGNLPIHKWPRYFDDMDQLWDILSTRLEQSELETAVITLRHIWGEETPLYSKTIFYLQNRLLDLCCRSKRTSH